MTIKRFILKIFSIFAHWIQIRKIMVKTNFLMFILIAATCLTVQAQSGKALELDGVNRYMTIPHHTDFNFSTSEEFSVTLWLYVNNYKTNARIVAKRGVTSAVDKSGYELWGTNSSANFFALNTPLQSGTNLFSKWGTVAGSTGSWIHLAFVVSRVGGTTVVYQYQNGQLARSSQVDNINMNSYAVSNAFDVYVGNGQYTAAYLNAKIDNLRFWKKGLTAAEVEADKSTSVNASTAGLVAAYDFETVDNGVVADIAGKHPATLVNFPAMGPVMVTAATVEQDRNFTGRANKNEVLLKTTLTTTGSEPAALGNLVLNLEGTSDLSSIDSLKVYTTGTTTKFDSRNPVATLLGKVKPVSGSVTLALNGALPSGTSYIWITADIAASASEGSKVDASVVSLTTSNQTFVFSTGNPAGEREVLLGRTLLFAPGDYGSTNYRIPAMITADDGALVTLTDKRKFNSTDLPEDIDVVCRRSTDGGRSWTEPVTVARGTGRFAGYGDAILTKTKSGRLVAVYVGGPGLAQSTSSNPIRTYVSYSSDHGVSWTAPRDITSQLWGAGCADPVRATWQASFCGAGQGLTLRNGRIMVVGTVREVSGGPLHNYAYYSDDEGETWSVSARAIQGGDEAKVVELNNGNVLMSSRASGNRLWAISTDGGQSWGARNSWTDLWGNACNGDMIRYTSTVDGFDKNRILHTLPNASNRSNLSVFMSYDEGGTWAVKKTVCAGTSAYASLTVLSDGTIGVYSEEDESVPYKMYFLNFSLDWLSSGADQYFPSGTPVVESPVFSVPAGTVTSDQLVSITTATEGATIYFTTDGTQPNTSSAVYTSPVLVNRTMVLKALAVKANLAPSVTAEATYIYGWALPGQNRATTSQRYLISAATSGAQVNLDYSTSVVPGAYFVAYNEQVISVKSDSEFTLNLEALKGQTDGLQWCQAIVLVDWNRDFDFADAGERVAVVGNRSTDNGNTLLSIAQKISVPAGAIRDIPTRLRVVYTDGWRPAAYTDYGFDPVDKGRLYEFDVLVSDFTSTETLAAERVQFNNPAIDVFTIRLREGDAGVSIVDLNGRVWIESVAVGNELSIPVSGLAAQVYIVKVKDKNGNFFSRKFVKL
jgi:sialidase-1